MPLATYKDLCIDAVDAHRLGTFWAAALGLDLERLDDGDVRLVGPTPQHAIWVNTVPEPITVKQRVHLDVDAASADDVIALGATPEDLDSFRWKVLRDPEGGELCVFEREEVAAYRLHQIVVDCRDHRAQATWWADVLGAEPRPRRARPLVLGRGDPGRAVPAAVLPAGARAQDGEEQGALGRRLR